MDISMSNGPSNRVNVAVPRHVEEMNNTGRRRKILLLLSLTIFILSSISLICYMYIATTVLDTTHATLQMTDVETMSVTYHEEDDKVAVSLKTSLKVGFYVPPVIMARPRGVAKFAISIALNETQKLRAFTTCRFRVSNDNQYLFLNFLTEQMSADLIRKMSDNELIWIRLTGDMKMKVKMAKFPVFPYAYQHIYLVCVVSLNAREPDKMNTKTCRTSVVKPFEQ